MNDVWKPEDTELAKRLAPAIDKLNTLAGNLRPRVPNYEHQGAVGVADAAAPAPVAIEKPDLVNHPPHYTSHPANIECIEVIEHMTLNVGNAIKYLWRAGLKTPDPIQDLRKAAWYVAREIHRLEAIGKRPA